MYSRFLEGVEVKKVFIIEVICAFVLDLFTQKDRSGCVRKESLREVLKHLHHRALCGSAQC